MRSDRVVAAMQFLLSLLFTVGYFVTLGIVLFGRADLPAEQIRLVDTLFGVLSAVLVQQSGYWFSRQRGTEGMVDSDTMQTLMRSQTMNGGGFPQQPVGDQQPTVINNYNAKYVGPNERLRPRRPLS